MKCLQKERAGRYQTSAELLSDLAQFEKEQTTGAQAAPQPDTLSGVREPGERSIAVLPFADLSPHKD